MWCVLFLVMVAVRAETEPTEPPPTNATELETTTETTESSNSSITTISPNTTLPLTKIIGAFETFGHGVSSGRVKILNNNTFLIPNFHFDGKAPRAYFLVGTGDEVSKNGTFVPFNKSNEPLPAYSGQDIRLTLPESLTVDQIDWLSVWCVEYEQNLGQVFLNKNLYPPQTFDLNDRVKSGPVVLIDKKTLYVPNFRYNGDHKNVHFWVGNGTPSSEGIPISAKELGSYSGTNLYLELPSGVTTDNIEYFGVWSIDEKISLGHVPIDARRIKGVPEAPIAKNRVAFAGVGKLLLRVPKCCPEDSVLTFNGCEKILTSFEPRFKVFEHNATHFNNESLDLSTIEFEPYTSNPNCSNAKYALDESDKFAFLKNESLLVKGLKTGILSQGEFCLDNILMENGTVVMKILVCAPEHKVEKAMFYTYIVLTIISTFCFAVTFFLYFFYLKIDDVHRKCFTGYVFTMTMTFLSLTIVQTANVEDGGCEVLGFFFQLFMIASFTLLGILCFDIMTLVKEALLVPNNETTGESGNRKYFYLGIAIGIPIFSLIISLSRNLTPDVPNSFFKPQYENNACYFVEQSQRTVFFYVPICFSIVASCACLLFTKLEIVKNDRNNSINYFWISKGPTYKFMFWQHVIIFITSVMWLIEAIIHNFFANTSMLIAIDMVEAIQGIVVLLLFVVNKEARNQIVQSIKARTGKRRRQNGIAYHIPGEEIISDVNNSQSWVLEELPSSEGQDQRN